MRPLVAIVALAAAGCIAPPTTDAPASAPEVPSVHLLADDCTTWTIGAPWVGTAGPRVPGDPWPEASPEPVDTMDLRVASCKHVGFGPLELQDVHFAWDAVGAGEPPEACAAAASNGATLDAVLAGLWSDAPQLLAVFQGWGLPVHAANFTWQPGTPGTFSITGPDGSIALSGVVPSNELAGSGMAKIRMAWWANDRLHLVDMEHPGNRNLGFAHADQVPTGAFVAAQSTAARVFAFDTAPLDSLSGTISHFKDRTCTEPA